MSEASQTVKSRHRHRGRSLVLVAALFAALLAVGNGTLNAPAAGAASPPTWRPFYYAVNVTTTTAYDPTRWTPARTATPAHPGRSIGLEVYAPVGLSGPLPTIIFAPGYRVGPAFDQLMLNSMASAGYLVIGLDFPGSTWANATGGPISRDLAENTRDMSFVLTWLHDQPEWRNRVDFSAVAAAGHSDGAIEVVALAMNSAYLDHRFAAFLQLSGGMDGSLGGHYGPYNTAPLLTSIGTNDEFGARPTTLATWNMAAGPKTLIDVNGGDHWQMYTLWSHQGDAVRGAIVEWLNLNLRHDPNAFGPFWANQRLGVTINTTTAPGIDAAYHLLGDRYGPLGVRTSANVPDGRGMGSVAHFQNGAIYDTWGMGLRVVWGGIWGGFQRLGTIHGPLGYPISQEFVASDRVGRIQFFQGGNMYWTPSTGAHEVHGSIAQRWGETGWQAGPLGYPTTDETVTPNGTGRYNHFQNGSIYWSPSTGAHVVAGAIRSFWAGLGWETSWLHYPTGEAALSGAAWRQTFQGGTVYASSLGTFALTPAGADRYVLAGGGAGPLGVPTSSTTGGTVKTTTFQHGSLVADYGTNTMTYNGPDGTTYGPIDSMRPWANRAYQQVLNRPVDVGGANYVVSQIRKGVELAAVAAGVAVSAEANARRVDQLYQTVLNRAADPGGSAWAMNFLAAGGKPTQLMTVLSGSPEFWSSAGGTPTGFVQLAYQRLLGRPADPGGLAYWSGQVAAGLPLTEVTGALGGSDEAARNAVTGVYWSVFGHGPDAGGLTYWANWWRLNGGDTIGLIARFTASVEFANH